MIEVILIIGQIILLGLTICLHVTTAYDLKKLQKEGLYDDDVTVQPTFVIAEVVIVLTLYYLKCQF